jgi:hypothetical protein
MSESEFCTKKALSEALKWVAELERRLERLETARVLALKGYHPGGQTHGPQGHASALLVSEPRLR